MNEIAASLRLLYENTKKVRAPMAAVVNNGTLWAGMDASRRGPDYGIYIFSYIP